MTNIIKVLQGIGITATSLVVLLILTWLIGDTPTSTGIITTLVNSLGFPEFEEIIWFGTIILYFTLGLAYPTYIIIEGIRETDENSKFQNIAIAIIIFIVFSVATYKAWYMTETIFAMANGAGNTLITTIFYISIILNWFLITIATPAYMIIHNLQEE